MTKQKPKPKKPRKAKPDVEVCHTKIEQNTSCKIEPGDGPIDWQHVEKIKQDANLPKRTRKPKSKLTDRQTKFVEEYAQSFNGAEAARKAGYSEIGSHVRGSELLANRNIKEELRLRMMARIEKANITHDSIVAEIAKIAFADVTDFSYWENDKLSFIDSKNLPNEVTSGIQSISTKSTEFGNDMSIKMHDKLKALELLGKHTGLFASCKQLEANITLAGSLGIEANVKAEIRKIEDLSDDELLRLVDKGGEAMEAIEQDEAQ